MISLIRNYVRVKVYTRLFHREGRYIDVHFIYRCVIHFLCICLWVYDLVFDDASKLVQRDTCMYFFETGNEQYLVIYIFLCTFFKCFRARLLKNFGKTDNKIQQVFQDVLKKVNEYLALYSVAYESLGKNETSHSCKLVIQTRSVFKAKVLKITRISALLCNFNRSFPPHQHTKTILQSCNKHIGALWRGGGHLFIEYNRSQLEKNKLIREKNWPSRKMVKTCRVLMDFCSWRAVPLI